MLFTGQHVNAAIVVIDCIEGSKDNVCEAVSKGMVLAHEGKMLTFVNVTARGKFSLPEGC